MAVTGPFDASTHIDSATQLLATTYGRVLIVKTLLVGGLLVTSIYHIGFLRPSLAKDYKKHKTQTIEEGTTSNEGSVTTLTKKVYTVEQRMEHQAKSCCVVMYRIAHRFLRHARTNVISTATSPNRTYDIIKCLYDDREDDR